MGKLNVNPDHYKTAGRERQGDDVVQEIHKQKLTQSDAAHAGQQSGANFIPGAAPVGERKGMDEATDANDTNETMGQVTKRLCTESAEVLLRTESPTIPR